MIECPASVFNSCDETVERDQENHGRTFNYLSFTEEGAQGRKAIFERRAESGLFPYCLATPKQVGLARLQREREPNLITRLIGFFFSPFRFQKTTLSPGSSKMEDLSAFCLTSPEYPGFSACPSVAPHFFFSDDLFALTGRARCFQVVCTDVIRTFYL